MRCIYCLNDETTQEFTKPEHVIPQSFGKFERNFTLRKTVCDECNQYFGDNLELFLARDSYEGLLRFKHGVKEDKDYKSVGPKSRLEITVSASPHKGVWVYLEYSLKDKMMVINLIPQIGFRKKETNEYQYFPIDQVPNRSEIYKKFDMRCPDAIRAFMLNPKEIEEKLRTLGIDFTLGGEIEPNANSELLCEIESTVDNIVRRAIAKISFNYLAYTHGERFVLQDDFNRIREYIRYDSVTAETFVTMTDEPILGDEPEEGLRRLGHLLVLEWQDVKSPILGKVSPFNYMTYRVKLAPMYFGQSNFSESGHFFDFKAKKIITLGRAR